MDTEAGIIVDVEATPALRAPEVGNWYPDEQKTTEDRSEPRLKTKKAGIAGSGNSDRKQRGDHGCFSNELFNRIQLKAAAELDSV